jgi:hypothetical protein
MRALSRTISLVTSVLALSVGQAFASNSDELKESPNMPGFRPKDGLVPDARTAVAIAVAVWSPVYGEKQIASEKPYNAVLKNGQWAVTGSLPRGAVGGTATAIIAKEDGRVIKIYHTK